ncbi:MAG TPA: cobalamin-binding protein [Nitrospiraceae bacterium]|jgi:5-methyltetrahydrofolate--homocysteine methyltransferase|nr:cobalamin-binding protein [Nitrospiraceae bacterium]
MKKAEYLSEGLGELEIYNAVVNGEDEVVREAVRTALAKGIPAGQILSDALIPAIMEVGRLFETHEYYVPEIVISAEAMQAGMAILRPLLCDAGERSTGRIALGSVEGDMHDIGKNLLTMMLESIGFHVTDLGVDVSPRRFVQAVVDGAQVIGMSAMLPTTMHNMKVVIDAMKAEGIRERVKVIVGGALVTQEFADRIGADGYAPDASAAVRKVRDLLSKAPSAHSVKEVADFKILARFAEA